MLDSLVLVTEAFVSNEALIDRWNPPTEHHHDHYNKVVYNNFKYQVGGANSPLLTYTKESSKFRVYVPSMPKFCLGTSAVAIDDNFVARSLDQVEQYVLNAGVQDLPPISAWHVASADIYCDLQVGEEVPNYISSLRPLSISGYKRVTYGDETIGWQRKSGGRDIKFYDREAKCISSREDPATAHFSQGIMRFEVKTRAEDYRRNIGSTDIGSIFKGEVILPMLQAYLDRLDLNNLRITTEGDMRRALTRAYGQRRGLEIMAFLGAQLNGDEITLSRSTIYRYKRDLQQLGLVPVIGIRRLSALRIGNIPDTQTRLAEFVAHNDCIRMAG